MNDRILWPDNLKVEKSPNKLQIAGVVIFFVIIVLITGLQ